LVGGINLSEKSTKRLTRYYRGVLVSDEHMNPFDLKAALLAKHAQHPVIIHFPIALFIASVAFDFLAIWKKNPTLTTVAYYNLLSAAISAPVAIVSGLTAWQWQLEGARLKGNLLLHLIFALSSSGMIWVLCGWRIRQQGTPKRPLGGLYFALALTTFVLIAVAGHLGGILSGVEGGAR
jgi:uncharacterized membrane protein